MITGLFLHAYDELNQTKQVRTDIVMVDKTATAKPLLHTMERCFEYDFYKLHSNSPKPFMKSELVHFDTDYEKI